MSAWMKRVAVISGSVMLAGGLQAGVILLDDFNNGDVKNANQFSGGTTNNFWGASTDSSNGSKVEETGGKLAMTVVNEAANYTRNLRTVNFSSEWDFFSKDITVKVRGISFSDTGSTAMPLNNMRMAYSFVANGDLFGGTGNTNAIRFLVQGDGKIELMLRKDSANSTIYNNGNLAVSGITGFDLRLGPGTGNTAYSLTVYNSGADVTTSGTLAMTAADWNSAVPNTSRISLVATESVSVNDLNQKFTAYTDSIEIVQEPAAVGVALYIVG
jgi:hypothetical protein